MNVTVPKNLRVHEYTEKSSRICFQGDVGTKLASQVTGEHWWMGHSQANQGNFCCLILQNLQIAHKCCVALVTPDNISIVKEGTNQSVI